MPLVLRDDLFLLHDPGPGHPENPGRLRAIYDDLDARPPAGLEFETPTPARQADLERIHTPEYLASLASVVGRRAQLDPDTAMSPRSYEAACLAAGAVTRAAEAVVTGRAAGAFALVRPPGHHAEAERAMGFCLINNVAVAAAFAADELSCKRVLILDPDVHHGNGTQWAFWRRPDVLYVSSHRFPFYPGTGSIAEIGDGPGTGFTINLPLPAGAGDAELLHVYEAVVSPVVREWQPDLLLVSAGFDTWRDDPIGGLNVSELGFRALFALFESWAAQSCPGRLALALEGGYDPAGLVAGVRAALGALGGVTAPPFSTAAMPAVQSVVAQAKSLLAPHWRSLR
ncbi:MAG: histone deacetylase family protein [Myxococcales bacterium]